MGNIDRCRDCGDYEICCKCPAPAPKHPEACEDRRAFLFNILAAEAAERVTVESRSAKGDESESVWFNCDGRYVSAWGEEMDYVSSTQVQGFRTCEELENFILCLSAALAEKRKREGGATK